MTLHYEGKYSGDPATLPSRDHQPGAVKFREPDSTKKLALVANGIALVLLVLTMCVYCVIQAGVLRTDLGRAPALWEVAEQGIGLGWWLGILLSLLVLLPHELLHAVCFKEDVYLYTNLRQGMLFVVGPEDMSKGRFIFMSLLPNLVFGFVPLLLYCVGSAHFLPSTHPLHSFWTFLGALGAFSLPMGAGDYLNVWHALTQMPKGARTYLHRMNSYWYRP